MYTSLKSVMSDRSSDKTSDRYSFVPTYKVINLLENNGWMVNSARETNSKRNVGFQKHIVRFRKAVDQNRQLEIDEIIPEIILTNAHDGTTRFNVMSGFERCWCSNQCTVSESTIRSHQVTHIGYTDLKILNAVDNIMSETPKVIDSIHRFKDIKLDDNNRWMMAEMALDILFDKDKWMKYNKDYTIKRLIQPQRMQDNEKNLWNTFNTIQERFIKGGRYLISNEEIAMAKMYGWDMDNLGAEKVRKVKSIDRDIQINRDLWELTENMEELIELGV